MISLEQLDGKRRESAKVRGLVVEYTVHGTQVYAAFTYCGQTAHWVVDAGAPCRFGIANRADVRQVRVPRGFGYAARQVAIDLVNGLADKLAPVVEIEAARRAKLSDADLDARLARVAAL